MALTEKSPYQIFAQPSLPLSWEAAFRDNLANWPIKLHPQLEKAWEMAWSLGLPDRKDESWRWMDYKRLDFESLRLNSQTSPIRLTVSFFSEAADEQPTPISLPEGVVITTLGEFFEHHEDLAVRLLTENDLITEGTFAALPSALANDGLIVYIPQDVKLDGMVQCLLEIPLDNHAVFTRNLVCLEEGASLNLELVWVSPDSYLSGFHNGILDVRLGQQSCLNLDEIQQFARVDWNISHERASLAADSQLEWNYAAIGSDTSKNFIKVELQGEGSSAVLNGAMFPTREQVINLDTRQNHWAESTFSNLMYKSVVSQRGRSVWHGMIYVDPEAQKTDAFQTNKNLVLDDLADVKSVPGLEIHANDVKCSHGATVGKIDPGEFYYLQTRGIPQKEAEKLIVEGFFNQIVQSFRLEKTQRELLDQLMSRMNS